MVVMNCKGGSWVQICAAVWRLHAVVMRVAMLVLVTLHNGCKSSNETPTSKADPEEKAATPAVPARAQAVPVAPPTPTWEPFSQTRAIDDSTVMGVRLLADEHVSTPYKENYWPRLWIGCDKDTTSAYFDVGTLLNTETRSWESDYAYGYRSGTPLRLRIDKETPISNFADMGADNTSAFLSGPIPILKKMFGHTTLLVEYAPMSSSRQTATFTISGIEAAITDVRKTCHW